MKKVECPNKMRIEKKECPLQNCSVVSWRAKNWSSCEIMSSEKSFYGSFCYRGSQTRVVECVSWQNGSISGTVGYNHDHFHDFKHTTFKRTG